MYGCESWTIKKAECQRIHAFKLWCRRRFLLDCKEIKLVNSEGNQSWIFIGRTSAEAETPILWPPDAKNWFIRKDPDAGKDWRQEEMAEWYHRLDGSEFEWILGVGDGQGGLGCCDSWGCKESDTTERLNWTDWTHSFKAHWLKKSPTNDWEALVCQALVHPLSGFTQ